MILNKIGVKIYILTLYILETHPVECKLN